MKLSKEFIAIFREEAKKAQWEINCWNGKSIDDLVIDYLERKELKPEDFKGAVILTVEEAKALLRRIPKFKECGDWQLPIERLKERISKAEGK